MSILKQVLVEAFASIFRRSAPPSARPDEGVSVTPAPGKSSRPTSASTRDAGMKVVILNWKEGENDPFTVVNSTIRQHLQACGKNVDVIEISDADWAARLADLASNGVEFAFTWQGLGSPATVGDRGESLWERLKIPLICVHGDHPSHMPANHQLDSRYCFHLYTNADSARYSNRYFRRKRGASVIDIPQLHHEPRLQQRNGDYFVVAKNIYDPILTEKAWQEKLEKRIFDAYMMAAETLKARIARERYVEIHDALDDLIAQRGMEWLDPAVNLTAYHAYHSQLDHHLRSHKTVTAVTALRDFPVRVYGRGWDRIARTAPASHVFMPGRNMADSQELYYTRFGLVDVSPSRALHDRTRRAMVNGTGFLSNANLEDCFADIARFDPLFFSFGDNGLPKKCAAVMQDPEGHRALAEEFADTYHNRFHFRDFVNRLDTLAKLAGAFQLGEGKA
jgi:hypothetical protein